MPRVTTSNTLYPTKLLRTFTTYRVPGLFNDKLTIGGGVNWQESVSLLCAQSGRQSSKRSSRTPTPWST